MKHPDIHAVLDDTLDGGAAYRLPELPNFGVFYINIPSAATLIVEDLKRNNQRVRFGMYDDADGSTEEREKNFQKGVAELISDLQMRLLHAVEHGKLKYFTKSRTLEDFLQKGDQMCLPELTFIHYTDLIAWLTHFGYIDRLISTDHPAFEEYERNELDLMENLENDVIVRRGSLGKRIQSPLRVLVPPASQDDERLQLQEQLAGAFMSLRELKRENEELHARVGGPPQRILIIRANDGSDDGKTEHFDDYPAAAMAEIVNMFHRTRRAVCRAQMLLVGNHFLHQDPDIFIAKMPPEVEKSFLESIDSSFWEQAEIAYIRLASYWDRVGQMLDFAFFSIRQFERDGFTAVADRIHTNFGPMDSMLKAMPEWKALRAFQTSEKEDGLKWLLRRRNLLVHSLYLRPLSDSLPTDDGEVLFTSEFNHLEESLRRRLAPGTPTQEIERLNFQLAKAAELYPAVLGVCEYAADRRASIAGR